MVHDLHFMNSLSVDADPQKRTHKKCRFLMLVQFPGNMYLDNNVFSNLEYERN